MAAASTEDLLSGSLCDHDYDGEGESDNLWKWRQALKEEVEEVGIPICT